MEQPQNNPIDVEKDPFAYNKDFDPTNPDNFTTWLNMRPTHLKVTTHMRHSKVNCVHEAKS